MVVTPKKWGARAVNLGADAPRRQLRCGEGANTRALALALRWWWWARTPPPPVGACRRKWRPPTAPSHNGDPNAKTPQFTAGTRVCMPPHGNTRIRQRTIPALKCPRSARRTQTNTQGVWQTKKRFTANGNRHCYRAGHASACAGWFRILDATARSTDTVAVRGARPGGGEAGQRCVGR